MSKIDTLTTVDLDDLNLDDATDATTTDAIDATLNDAPTADDVKTASPRALALTLNHDCVSHDDFASRMIKHSHPSLITYLRKLRKHYRTHSIRIAHDALLTRTDIRADNRLISKSCVITISNTDDVITLDTDDLPTVRVSSPRHTVVAQCASLTCADVSPVHLAYVAVIFRALRPYHNRTTLTVTTMNKYACEHNDLVIPYNISVASLTFRVCRFLMPCDITALVASQSIVSAYFKPAQPMTELDTTSVHVNVIALKYPLNVAVK
jgi:hypothetical protein